MLEKKNIGFYLFAFMLALPFPLIYAAIAMGIMVVNAALLTKKENFKLTKWVVLCLLFFSIDIIRSLLFEASFKGFSETKLSFIVVPILFYNIKEHLIAQRKNIMRFFAYGVVAYVLYAIGYLIFFYIKWYPRYIFSFTDHYVVYVLFNYLPGAYHHTYIGIYIAFAMIILFDEVKHTQKKSYKYLKLFLFFLIFLMQFYIGSKMTMALSVLGLLIYVSFSRLGKKMFYTLFAGISAVSLVFFFFVKDWIMRGINKSVGYRLEYWEKASELIQENPWFGIGVKNIKKNELLMLDGEIRSLIPHNLYLHELLANGIFGIIFILFLFYFLFRKAFEANDVVFISFMFLCALLSLSEDLLYLQKGIFFFILFATLFVVTHKKKDAMH
jgi:O-antigen ligase